MLDSQLRFDKSALLLLDMQNGFLKPDSPFIRGGLIPSIAAERAELISNIQSALNAMRQAGRPVFFINTAFRADHADCYLSPSWRKCLAEYPQELVEGTESAAVVNELKPQKADFVIVKKGHSAFQFTHLDRALAALGIDTCVVAGNVLSSVEETIRQGAALGYENILLSNASFPLRFRLLKTLGSRTFDAATAEFLDWTTQASPAVTAEQRIKPCLLVIDIQNDFMHPQGSQIQHGVHGLTDEDRAQIVGNNLRLLKVMRAKGWPIIYVKSLRGQDRFVDTASARMALRKRSMEYRTDGSWGAEIVDELKPEPKDYVIGKRGHSAFGTTHLHRMLRNLGVNTIVVTGGSVVGCVADSTREGVGLGYRVILVGDATYPPDKRDIGLASLGTRLEVRTADETLQLLEKSGAEKAGFSAQTALASSPAT